VTDAVKWKGDSDENPVLAKAAFLLWYLAGPGHVFIEGNKRTAQMVTLVFLELNGNALQPVQEEEMAAMVLAVASGKISLKSIVQWLKENVKNPEV
jgi:death-on-curing family protein